MSRRYQWICSWTNQASDWKDLEVCGAKSTNAYETPELAQQAARRHRCRGRGGPIIEIVDLFARKRARR